MEKDGYEIVQRVEIFFSIHNKTPENNDLTKFEDEHGIGPFYEKKSDSTYIVYFSLGFDDFYIYDSGNQEWNYFPQQYKSHSQRPIIQRLPWKKDVIKRIQSINNRIK